MRKVTEFPTHMPLDANNIEITDEMIDVGVWWFNQMKFGDNPRDVVKAIYWHVHQESVRAAESKLLR
jgi:hypothetical protein